MSRPGAKMSLEVLGMADVGGIDVAIELANLADVDREVHYKISTTAGVDLATGSVVLSGGRSVGFEETIRSLPKDADGLDWYCWTQDEGEPDPASDAWPDWMDDV